MNSENNTNFSSSDSLSRRQVRSVYLITYSRANSELVDSRNSFARVVLDSFANADCKITNKVLQWACCEERHKDGAIHYHMAVKLQRNRRWLKVRSYADKKHGVKLNFSSNHANYYSAWKYVTKEDTDFLQSEGHPDLNNAPQTHEACEVRSQGNNKKKAKGSRRKRAKRLSTFDVSQIAVNKGIKTRLELLAFANAQKKSGKTDLAEFIATRGFKAVEDALKIGWELEQAPHDLERLSKTRMEILTVA